MLELIGLQETRFYQEAKQEYCQEGRIEEHQSLILDQLTGLGGEYIWTNPRAGHRIIKRSPQIFRSSITKV